MLKKQLLILFLTVWPKYCSCVSIGTLWELAQYGWKFAETLNTMADENKNELKDFVSILGRDADHHEIIEKLDKINNKLKDLQSYTKHKLNDIEALISRLPDEIELRAKRDNIVEFMRVVHRKWNLFEIYMKNENNATTEQALNQLAGLIIDSIGEKLDSFRNLITPFTIDKSNEGFFMLMSKNALDKIDIICGTGETSHHIITRLYQFIIETEIKAYILQFFAHRYQLSERGGWKTQCSILEQEFWGQFRKYTDMYKMSLNSTKLPYIRTCDPEVWQKDENFYELDGLIQLTTYGFPECWRKGSWNCERLGAGEGLPRCSLYPMSDHASCDSALFNCEKISRRGLFSSMEVCLEESGPHRIRYIKINENTYGTGEKSSDSCSSKNKRSFIGFSQPLDDEICSCYCHSKKWRILAGIQWSDILNNQIIVGLRFKKEDHIIYIQIAQGRLGKGGHSSNFSWVEVKKLSHHLKEITIENAVFYLDDLQLPSAHALIGISLIRLDSESPGGFSIRLYGIEIDYDLGEMKMSSGDLYWLRSVLSSRSQHKEYSIKGFSSTNMKPYEASRPISREYHRISFRQSEISHDFAQSSLPFFDAVPVETNPLSPIGGVGLFLKDQPKYAGFLSLRLFPLNYTYHMNAFLQKHNLSLPSIWND